MRGFGAQSRHCPHCGILYRKFTTHRSMALHEEACRRAASAESELDKFRGVDLREMAEAEAVLDDLGLNPQAQPPASSPTDQNTAMSPQNGASAGRLGPYPGSTAHLPTLAEVQDEPRSLHRAVRLSDSDEDQEIVVCSCGDGIDQRGGWRGPLHCPRTGMLIWYMGGFEDDSHHGLYGEPPGRRWDHDTRPIPQHASGHG